MHTEFEVSVRFVCWGDKMDPMRLVESFKLDPSFCTIKYKGDTVGPARNGITTSFSKTCLLTYTYDNQFPKDKHNPLAQLKFIIELLKNIHGTLSDSYNVDEAELQIFLYYGTIEPGEVNFQIPDLLLSELCKHNIRLSVSALP